MTRKKPGIKFNFSPKYGFYKYSQRIFCKILFLSQILLFSNISKWKQKSLAK